MKKLLALVLALILAFGVIAFAESTETAAEQAEETVKETEETEEKDTAEEDEKESEETAAAVEDEKESEETAAEEEEDLNETMYVSAYHGLKMHTEADLESEVTIVALFNQKVTVHSYTEDGLFAKVSFEYEGEIHEGFMWAEYLSATVTKIVNKSSKPVQLGICPGCNEPVFSNQKYSTEKGDESTVYIHEGCYLPN